MMLLSLRTLGPDCTPELHTRAAPHPSMSRPRHSLPSKHVLPQQQSKRVRMRSQIRFVNLSFMSGLQLRQDQPISKKKKKRTNRDFLTKAK